ncbi:alkaline phosphatase family protein [Mycetocola sp.]|uniref:alkaline phosphatase family protein n=1 Tax=Mycetocola sp. TaxID=1871042 RepID=UPI003989B8EA
MRNKVLLVGIDGVRRDVLERIATPHIDAIAKRGGRKAIDIDERCRTISGPMWTTILTGAFPERHGVEDNRHPPESRVPDVFSRLAMAGKIHMPIAATSWPPLTSRAGCGPIIDPSLVRVYTAPLVKEDFEAYFEGDIKVRDAAVEFLSIAEVDAAFVYFGLVDEVGHSEGVGHSYAKALQRCDEHVGIVMEALSARADRDDWSVVVTTDHGHVDAGGHGGSSAGECEIWALSDSEPLLSLITGPQDIAAAIESVYGRD